MIALGWTATDIVAPTWLTIERLAHCSLILADATRVWTPRMRMAMQLRIFSAGIDFCPAAASEIMTRDEAKSADGPMIANALANIAGMGQLTISLNQPGEICDPLSNGRAWLAQRQHKQQRKAALVNELHALIDRVGHPCSQLRQNGSVLACDILIPRNDEAAVRSRIAVAAQSAEQSGQTQGAVTGLWPAYGFTPNTQERAA